MTAKSKSKQIRPAKTAQSIGIEERIRRRACVLNEQRGRIDAGALCQFRHVR